MPKTKLRSEDNPSSDTLTHREKQQRQIEKSIQKMIHDQETIDLLCEGPTGTGKTETVKQAAKNIQNQEEINICYADCFSEQSRFEVFYELLDKKIEVPRDGTSTEKIIDLFKEKVREKPTVIVIENADKGLSDDTLYDLTRFRSATLILISNDLNFLAGSDSRVRSRISALNQIEFPEYSRNQLLDLIKEEQADSPLELDESYLKKIAEEANGDATKALQTYQKLVERIRFSEDKAEERFQKVIEKVESDSPGELPEELRKSRHHEAIYKILQSSEGGQKMDGIYDRYTDKLECRRTRRTIRRYLNQLANHGLIEKSGIKSGTTYRVQ
jgi:Cdc6-like AAA superfamily ATPase